MLNVHIERLPCLSLTVFDRSYGGVHQSYDRDKLAYRDVVCERQRRAYELVCEQNALAIARVNGGNSAQIHSWRIMNIRSKLISPLGTDRATLWVGG